MNRPEILLVYDKECPVCDAYCRIVRVRETVGELKLIDARSKGDIMNEITAKGLDIDQGMVLKMDDRLYYGSDAIHTLALISSRSGIFNRFNYWIFRSRILSAWFYPILRFFRNLLLKLLGKTKIDNLELPNNEKF
ncbi:MAG: DCC1-like thiol-disulfide oxidoreductase family protein [Gammaproteobacteria bacterium]|jgi:predicted DCC family thiol-disulfide oxidoreductase YuxK